MKKIEQAPHWKSDKDNLVKGFTLFDDIKIKPLLNKINDKCLYWDKVKYQKTNQKISPEVLWVAVKISRANLLKDIHFGSYKFRYYLSNKNQKLLHEFDLNIGGQLGTKSILPQENKKQYLISSIMEEAIASSQIEGAVTTRKRAKEMLRKNKKPRTKSEQMVVNNYQTIKHIVETEGKPLTEESLFEIHRLITHQTLDKVSDEGQYRQTNEVNVVDVIDGEIVHSPPDYKEIHQLMNEFFTFFNTESEEQFIHPIVKASILHFMLGFIHPFVDGNGRTARALFYWYLLKNGYWLTEYLSISKWIIKSKNQYALAFLYSEIDDNDLSYFIDYNLKIMDAAYQSLRDYMQRKIDEKKQLIEFQKIKGVNQRQAQILKWIYEEATLLLTVKEIENRLSVSNQTARNDLIQLVNEGYLKLIEVDRKTKSFCKSDDFTRILKQKTTM